MNVHHPRIMIAMVSTVHVRIMTVVLLVDVNQVTQEMERHVTVSECKV